jgi:TRAP-type C4-dicarboxylate transport system permease small subunit
LAAETFAGEGSSMSGIAATIDRGILLGTKGLAYLAGLCVFGMFAVIVTSVVMRYAVSRPLAFTEELTGLLLATSIFLVIPHVTAAHLNIRVTLLSDRFSGAARRAIHIIAQGVVVAFLAVFLIEAQKFVNLALRFNEKTELTRLPIAPFKTAMALSLALTLLIVLWQALRPPPEGDGLKI